ncbi:MAG TPA: ABC transporter substrate-binding protein [Methanocorpusculum sp.]|nr:ABC transporter substrate-binding protein [Methanocorpusculum sp.]HJK80260.1 ABC transporter substrate-binding protein [Methanocorpusculum sp.]
MKHLLPILLLLALLCGTAAAAEWTPVTITDDYGYTAEISAAPQTIVSLGPSNTEILFALGLGDKVAGVTEYCNYPAAAQTKSLIGGVSSPNIEKIVALNPDLILANAMNGEDNIAHLRKLGYTVLCLNPDSVDGTFSSIRRVGEATGTSAAAEELIASMQQRFRAAAEKVKTAGTTPLTVTHLMSTDPYWVSGIHTFQDELITLAGGTNAFPEVDGWGIINLEHLLTTDPDVILVDSGAGMGEKGENLLKQSFMTDPRLSSLTAVKNNRIYVMDSDTFDRGGPRIVDAFDELVAVLYPESAESPAAATPQAPGFGSVLTLAGGALALLILRKNS